MHRIFHSLLLTLSLLLLSCSSAGERLEQHLTTLVKGRHATVGVAVTLDGKPFAQLNNGERYPLMSVFKFHQSLAVAHTLEERRLSPDTLLQVKKEELPSGTYSPLRDRHPDRDIDITVRELLRYTLCLSDNNACDILFRRIIDPKATDAFLRSRSAGDFAITADEEEMNRHPERCYDNWTTPMAAARLMAQFLNGEIIAEPYRSFIRECLISATTGHRRLRQPLLDTPLTAGDKTGTGPKDDRGALIAVNDLGFVELPDGRSYTIAVFVKDSRESLADTERLIAEIAAAVHAAIIRERV